MPCPDPDQLAAFVAHALSIEARGAVLDHAAGCAECRAALAVLDTGDPATRSTQASVTGPIQSTVDEAPPRPGDTVDRYVLVRMLGAGAMGVVFAARDPELDREVALKLLRPGASAERLRREAQALARLAHPHVVRIHDVGEHRGRTFIAMELVDGENLRRWSMTPRSMARILDVIRRAGEGLAAAHHRGLIHRDLKPDNILVASDGNVLVGDFGLARSASSDDVLTRSGNVALPAVSTTLTASGMLLGTPAYMAPEQAAGEATAASDQYAFCVTAWEACFGRRPILGATLEELVANARAGRIHRPTDRTVPARVERALRRGLSPRPEDRFPSMDALLAALAPPRRRWPWIAAAGGVVAVAAATVALASTRGGDRAATASCDDLGDDLATVWRPEVADTLGKRFGAPLAAAFDRYAAAWTATRIEVCRATHVRREQRVETLELRVACLERARGELGLAVDLLTASAPDALPQAWAISAGLPPLERCGLAMTPRQVPPPGPAQAAAVAALDQELSRVELERLASAQGSDLPTARGLRQRAETLAHPPQVLRALLLEADVAHSLGENAEAEAILRRLLVEAEGQRDDGVRAGAGAQLAALLARTGRIDAARDALGAARGALARLGGDRTIEVGLARAEIRIALAAGQTREAVALQEKLIALLSAVYGDESYPVGRGYLELGPMWAQLNDLPRAATALDQGKRRLTSGLVRVEGDNPALHADSTVPLSRGDFATAIDIERARLAALLGMPHPLMQEALVWSQLAVTHELDGDQVAAAAAFRTLGAIVSRPVADFQSEMEDADVVARLQMQEDALEGEGRMLVRLGRPAEALALLRAAHAAAIAGGAATAAALDSSAAMLARALILTGEFREGRELLEPVHRRYTEGAPSSPYGRAIAASFLAQALWETGDQRDRGRALALADDAERHFADTLQLAAETPALRKLPGLVRVDRETLRAWRAKREPASQK